jgi:hypothetical protein
MTRRSTVPAEERGAYMPLPNPSPVATSLAQKDASAKLEPATPPPAGVAQAG